MIKNLSPRTSSHALFFTLFLLLPITALAQAKNTPNWLRYPSISPDGKTIAFVYKGNIYSIPSKGGTAKQLTTHKAYDFHPVWSHDGKTIAFATARHGNFDIYTMNVNGEEVKRLTYHSNDEIPYTFSADDQSVIFGGVRMDLSAHRQYPTASQPELYQVPAQGGASLKSLPFLEKRPKSIALEPVSFITIKKEEKMPIESITNPL